MKRNVFSMAIVLALLVSLALVSAAPSQAVQAERVLVEFVPGRAAAVRGALEGAGGSIHYQFDRLNLFAVTLPAAAVDGIARNPNVVAVAPDVPRYPMGQTIPWGIDRVQAPSVWSADVTGSDRLVCVIDSGLYTGHEDMKDVNVAGGYPSGWNTDGCGHGTHVAGTIAAANNTTGVVGVTPGDTSLYIVKVFGDDCSWSYSSDLIDATDRCYGAGADIISMSLGGGKPRGPWEQNQFDWLWNQGVLSIAAAGNAGDTSYSYPASHSSVVSVAATDINNVVADFSQQNDQVELAAPGVDVLSTVPWLATDELTVDGVTYDANHIEYAPYGTASGALVDGGLCDTTGSWSGNVVLCERGSISFYDKVMNVQNSGGVAAVIYNNEPGNFYGTLGEGYSSDIVAISLSQEDGQYLVADKFSVTGDVKSSISKPDSGYEAWNGTSMATPHVSGVAALLWSSNTALTNADIRNAMNATALDLGAAGRDNAYGYGLVQAYDALTYLGGENQAPTASFTYTTSDLTVTFTDTSTDSDGSIVSWSWDFGDGATSTAQNPSHTYATDGTYTVNLTVTDDDGATDTASQSVIVSSSTTNSPPTADFTFTTSDLTATFTDQSTDSDGTVVAWSWNFGDGATSTAQNPSHTYTADGTYSVSLTVTDDGGATDSTSQSVSVTSGGSEGISLTATGYKVRGRQTVDLTWSGATSTNVDVYRDGALLTTTANDGFYTDNIDQVGGGSYTYKVCEAGTSNCSNEATVIFQ
jgi:serine protease